MDIFYIFIYNLFNFNFILAEQFKPKLSRIIDHPNFEKVSIQEAERMLSTQPY